ncbi:MAG: preprotein translocase subunit SecD [Marmoricola sp.]|nr:preprotein translocase subunit SecD [Marmoricola sp.]
MSRARVSHVSCFLVAALLLAGCGGHSTAAGHGPTPTPSLTPSTLAPTRPGQLQFRVVLRPSAGAGAPTAPAPEVLRFASFVCPRTERAPHATGAKSFLLACDHRTKYLLAPASWAGKVRQVSTDVPPGESTWVVNIEFDRRGTAVLARLTRKLFRSGGRLGLVVGGKVLTAASVDAPITDGSIEISGSFTQTAAVALAHQIAVR